MDALFSYAVRPARNQDAAAIYDLISSILQAYGIATNPDTTERDLVDLEGYYGGEKGAFYVLLDGDRVVGTAAFHRHDEQTCELGRMYLAPDYRRRGLGRALLEMITREIQARGFRRMRLATASVLTEAITLYSSVGFSRVCGGASGGNCDVVMEKELPKDGAR
jgi:putative acetyltransferase